MKRLLLIAILVGLIAGLRTAGPVNGRVARAGTAPLESLPLVGGSGCAISAGCPGKAGGVLLAHGLHVDGSSYAELKLGRRYTSVAGTIYLDDSSQSSGESLTIYDSSDNTKRSIYSVYVSSGKPITFAIGVQGVDRLYIISPYGTSNSIDLVAVVAPADAPTAPSGPPVADVPAPSHPGSVVAVVLPGPNVVLIGTPIVPFAWKPFPGAADYLLQLWLARATPGQRLVATARVNIAATVAATHYELSTARMPRGSYRWRIAALNAQGTLISTWSPESTVTLG